MRKKPNRTKSTALSFYVSDLMSSLIHERADECGLSLTAYLTLCAIGKEIVRIDGLDDFIKALKATGNNLNQLTTLANMNRISTVDLSECKKLYADIQKSLKEILERSKY